MKVSPGQIVAPQLPLLPVYRHTPAAISRYIRPTPSSQRGQSNRWLTQSTKTRTSLPIEPLFSSVPVQPKAHVSPLAQSSISDLTRSLVLGYTFSSPRLLSLGLQILKILLDSKSAVLNPDKNPVLRAILRKLLYNQFCAGVSPEEVRQKVQEIKDSGCSGVILGFAREILADVTSKEEATSEILIGSWLQANLETLALIGPGDYMNIKLTGAGPSISEAMLAGKPPPEPMKQAMDTICNEARSRGVRVWVDAEMQFVQSMVDRWAVDLMQRHNKDGDALVYNTYQSYLKASRSVISEHMRLAKEGGWTLGIKLVRGAYIQNEIRDRIWSTKAETDTNYNSIVRDVLTKTWPLYDRDTLPSVKIFLAGHNRESIQMATELIRDLVNKGEHVPAVQFGQLQGMADDVNYELVKLREAALDTKGLSTKEAELRRQMAPEPYKCLCWGSVSDCLGFLMRRAVENASATDRLKDNLREVKAELKRRLSPFKA